MFFSKLTENIFELWKMYLWILSASVLHHFVGLLTMFKKIIFVWLIFLELKTVFIIFLKQGQIPNHLSLRTFLFPIFCFFSKYIFWWWVLFIFSPWCVVCSQKTSLLLIFLVQFRFEQDTTWIFLQYSDFNFACYKQ